MVETATAQVVSASDFLGKTITLTNTKYPTTQVIGKCETITTGRNDAGDEIVTSVKLEGFSSAHDIDANASWQWSWAITQVA